MCANRTFWIDPVNSRWGYQWLTYPDNEVRMWRLWTSWIGSMVPLVDSASSLPCSWKSFLLVLPRNCPDFFPQHGLLPDRAHTRTCWSLVWHQRSLPTEGLSKWSRCQDPQIRAAFRRGYHLKPSRAPRSSAPPIASHCRCENIFRELPREPYMG